MKLNSVWLLWVTNEAEGIPYLDSLYDNVENAIAEIKVICEDEGYINLIKKSDFCYIAIDEDNCNITFKIEGRIVRQ